MKNWVRVALPSLRRWLAEGFKESYGAQTAMQNDAEMDFEFCMENWGIVTMFFHLRPTRAIIGESFSVVRMVVKIRSVKLMVQMESQEATQNIWSNQLSWILGNFEPSWPTNWMLLPHRLSCWPVKSGVRGDDKPIDAPIEDASSIWRISPGGA